MKTHNTQNTSPLVAAALAALTGIGAAAVPASLAHRWNFNGNLNDSVTTGASNATIVDPDNNATTGGSVDLTTNNGQATFTGGDKGTSSYISLGTNLLKGKTGAVTIELWATPTGIQDWSRIFDFGTDTNQYLMMSWTRGTNANQDTLTWKNGNENAVNDKNAPYTLGQEYHIVMVVEPGAGAGGQTLVTEYCAPSNATTMGAAKVTLSTAFTLATLNDPNDYLGRSQWPDRTAQANYNEFRIWNGAMVSQEVDARQLAGANATTTADTDGDGMPDWWETLYGLNPNSAADANTDLDGDGASNLAEYNAGSKPNDANSNALDLDGDGLTDSWEVANFGGLGETGTGDPDGDGATNKDEQAAGSNPLDPASFPDTDADGLNDVWEKKYFTTINAANAIPTADPDSDGFTNLEEFRAGTNPTVASSSPISPTLLHRWSFNGALTDSVTTGASNATIVDPDNAPTVGGTADLTTVPGSVFMAGGDKGTSAYVSLGTNLLKGNITPITLELWATNYSLKNWSRVFDFGSSETEYIMWSWNVNGNNGQNRASWKKNAELELNNTIVPFADNTEYHMVVTIEPPQGARKKTRLTIYAADSASTSMGLPLGELYTDYKLNTINDVNDWLGRSQFGDATANASYNEVRIWAGLMPAGIRDIFQVQGPNNITLADTDNDKLPDAWETATFGSLTQTGTGDPDSDTFSNLKELAASTDPNSALFTPNDTDGNALPDTFEYTYFGQLGQDPLADPDNDLATTDEERIAGTNPADRTSFPDTDGDGISDAWEKNYFPGPLTNVTATTDHDHDGLTDKQEFVADTDPTDALAPGNVNGDGDGDGLDDRWEVTNFGNDISLQGATGDPDGDGANNLAEYLAGSNPNSAASKPTDVNGDGITDQTVAMDFKAAGTSGVNDSTGKVTGLVRLGNTGTDATFTPNDPNLALTTTGIGTLNIISTNSDFNNQIGIPKMEALGIPLSSLGVGPGVDFKMRAKFVNLPALVGGDQLGAFVGSSSTAVTRFGRIDAKAIYSTNTDGNVDGGGLRTDNVAPAPGTSMTLEVSRIAGAWTMTVNDIPITPAAQPAFLDAHTDLIAGVYSLDLSGTHNTSYLDSLTVTRFGTSGSGVADSDNDGMDDAWETAKFGNLNQTGTGDFDNDGIPNLSEFAFNGNPTSGSSRGQITTALTDTDSNGKKELVMTVAVRTGATFAADANGAQVATVGGITYTIRGSLDMVTFNSPVAHVGSPVAGDAGYELHTFRLTASDGLGGKGFLQATVTK